MKVTVTRTLSLNGKHVVTTADYEEKGFPLVVERAGCKPVALYPDVEKIGKALFGAIQNPRSSSTAPRRKSS